MPLDDKEKKAAFLYFSSNKEKDGELWDAMCFAQKAARSRVTKSSGMKRLDMIAFVRGEISLMELASHVGAFWPQGRSEESSHSDRKNKEVKAGKK